jgi:hypothetical protein
MSASTTLRFEGFHSTLSQEGFESSDDRRWLIEQEGGHREVRNISGFFELFSKEPQIYR